MTLPALFPAMKRATICPLINNGDTPMPDDTLFALRAELAHAWTYTDQQYEGACRCHAPMAEIRELRIAVWAAARAVAEFDAAYPEVIDALNRGRA